MPKSIFLSHGSPMIAILDNEYTRFLTELGASMQPKAIVLFSAHWETEETTISFQTGTYETIYDFYGFPDELFQVKYPATGSIEIATEVERCLSARGIAVNRDESRGLDHGSWSLLKHLYPNANIPVVQISVNPFLPAEQQLLIGEALSELDEDILLIGSGATVHNLRMLKWEQTEPEAWAVQFDDWLIEKLEKKQWSELAAYREHAPHAALAVPRAEHFVPFFIALGSAGAAYDPKVIHRSYEMGTLSYMCMSFT
ncbi:class III extradiol ring-cleavage dioxygenase [Paenibacillaceae sp. P-4]|uniref:Dioxygenase n=1 Tax=Paenibacillus popilliae TaxID=78057 RepID=A0ABY3AU14_PAEPP|nr:MULTISPECIES: class III extradiol ring-cleavage dioxygenase [Paenibacillus]EPY10443.1 oxidoreductase [Paenibacillus alvei A6-6i-x]TQR45466.1 dioxygenase [Paenibacillus sp. SDF0028]SDF11480.1 Aromatic ring-opening dioxygenase, catalytic subunit, LigB family [Paenibacillus sp. cl6col]